MHQTFFLLYIGFELGLFVDTTAAEALSWLEQHGITMISSSDSPTLVTSSVEGGQTLALTGSVRILENTKGSYTHERSLKY